MFGRDHMDPVDLDLLEDIARKAHKRMRKTFTQGIERLIYHLHMTSLCATRGESAPTPETLRAALTNMREVDWSLENPDDD